MKQNYTTGWLKFWLYFRFPVGLIFGLTNFSSAYMNEEMLSSDFILVLLMCIDLAVLILMGITYYYICKREKNGYILIKIYLIVELIYISINSAFRVQHSTILEYAISMYMSILLLGLIWTLPNYVYFLKRKWWFEKVDNEEIKKMCLNEILENPETISNIINGKEEIIPELLLGKVNPYNDKKMEKYDDIIDYLKSYLKELEEINETK